MRNEHPRYSPLPVVGLFALAGVLIAQGCLLAAGHVAPVAAAAALVATLALIVARRPDFRVLRRGRTLLDALLAVTVVGGVSVLVHRYAIDARRLAWTYESGPDIGVRAQAADTPAWGTTLAAIALHAAPSLDGSVEWPNVISAPAPGGGGATALLGLPAAHRRLGLRIAQPPWAVFDANAAGGVTGGDGVQVRVMARARDNVETAVAHLDIKPQLLALDRRWHTLEADIPAGTRAIVVRVLCGGVASHNYCDHVLISVERLESRIGGFSLDRLMTLADGALLGLFALVTIAGARRKLPDPSNAVTTQPPVAAGRGGSPAGAGAGRCVLLALLMSPLVYMALLILPPPLGLGLYFANDFTGHRIWYTQVDAYFVSRGYFALWNPTFEFGNASLAGAFGTGALYPLRWWTYLPTCYGGILNFYTQYVQVALHMTIGLGGLYLLLRRHACVGPAAAALGSGVFLLNQCFNNFIRFPHGIENACWAPWMLHLALNLTRPPVSEPRTSGLEATTTHGPEARTTHGRESRATHFFALALCVALGWLAGYGQFSYMGALLVGLLALFNAQSLAGFLRVAGAGLLGSAAALGAILPAVEWAVHHPLRGGKDMSGIATIGVTDYAEILLNPFGVDVHYNTFTLPLFVMLGVAGLVAAWRRPKTLRPSLAMLVALALMIEVTRGDQGYLFAIFYRYLPMFSAFNSPAKYAWLLFIPIAWFVAIGVDALANRRAAWPAAAAITFAAAACAILAAPRVAQPVVGMHQPLAMHWLAAADAALRFQVLLWVSAAAGALFLLVRRPGVQAALIVILAATCALAFAAKGTFFWPEPDPAALIATRDAFPDGLLARRSPAEYLRLRGIGVTSPNVDPDVWHLIVSGDERVLGPPDARFPRTRFLWTPDVPTDKADFRLTSFGPNHCFFEIETTGPGEFTWLTRCSPHWRFRAAYLHRLPALRADPEPGPTWHDLSPGRLAPYEQFFRFRVHEPGQAALPVGSVAIRAEFVPPLHIGGAALSVALVFGLAAATAWSRRRRALAATAAAAGVVIAGLVLAGSLSRHTMSARDVFGVAGAASSGSETRPELHPRPIHD